MVGGRKELGPTLVEVAAEERSEGHCGLQDVVDRGEPCVAEGAAAGAIAGQ